MIAPVGELNFASVLGVLNQLEDDAEGLDLAQVTRSDSAGIALLLEWNRRTRARAQEPKIHNANEQVRSLAAFFGVDSLLKFQ